LTHLLKKLIIWPIIDLLTRKPSAYITVKKGQKNIKDKGSLIRDHIINMSYWSKTAETGSALCISDILAVLYFKILHINPKKPDDFDRDRFLLSKGHGASALYAALAERGFFSVDKLKKYRVNGGIFHGHPSKEVAPGIEISSGSLGHGLSIGAGMALVLKKSLPKRKVFVLMGDGECNEGSVWEATMFIASHKLNNVIAIIDDNGFQGFGKTSDVHTMDLATKFKAFGWQIFHVDGHNPVQLEKILNKAKTSSRPCVVIAKTITGKSIPNIENTLHAHYYIVDEKTHKNHHEK